MKSIYHLSDDPPSLSYASVANVFVTDEASEYSLISTLLSSHPAKVRRFAPAPRFDTECPIVIRRLECNVLFYYIVSIFYTCIFM